MTDKRTILLAAAALGLAAGSQGAFAKDLIYATFVPPSHGIVVYALEPLARELKAETKGSVNFVIRAGAQLFKGPTSITSTGQGLADATTYAPHYKPSLLPHSYMIIDLQLLVPAGHIGAAAAMDTVFHCPECQGAYKKAGTILLGAYGTGPQNLWCRSEAATVAQFKGKRVRTSGATGRLVKALGGTPVNMAISEMPGAMERGQIDCVIGPKSWVTGYGMIDNVKFVLDHSLGAYPFAHIAVMNLNTWKERTPAERRIMLRHFARAQARSTIDGNIGFDDRSVAAMKERNVSFKPAGEDYRAVVREQIETEKKLAIEGARSRGVKNAQKIAAMFEANLKKWEKILENKPLTWQAYDQALWENLDSKLDPEKL
jgi:TRAP-type C4-dicarboxylate transport system substrate-binding protein